VNEDERALIDDLTDALVDAEALLIGPMNTREWGAARAAFITKARALIKKTKGEAE
jgi:hypothetical protein